LKRGSTFAIRKKRQQHFENGIGEAGGLLEELVSYSEVSMLLGNSGTIDESGYTKIDSGLSYSPSLEAAMNRVLGDLAFVGERETPSFKFIRAARFLKDNAPHAFQIREMGTPTQNSMDRWLWNLLDWNIEVDSNQQMIKTKIR
jgi:hypothetical protein